MRGWTTHCQYNHEPLVLKDKVGRHPDEHGMRKSVECYAFSLQSFDTGSKDVSFELFA